MCLGSSADQLSAVHDDRIHDENARSKQQRRDYINSRVGTGPQPVLESLKYRVSDLDSSCCMYVGVSR